MPRLAAPDDAGDTVTPALRGGMQGRGLQFVRHCVEYVHHNFFCYGNS
nr:MAG TPA: hypothetical protein [Caudoviricetes sp.]